jgi:katanin p60 ATPase-containing subunit A1
MSLSLIAIKASSEAITAEQKRLVEKKRNVLVLVNQYLIENGFIETAERFQHEAGSSINKFIAADNIDLNLILSEYESYYELRFDKKPKLVRKMTEIDEQLRLQKYPSTNKNENNNAQRKNGGSSKERKKENSDNKLPSLNNNNNNNSDQLESSFSVQGTSAIATTNIENNKNKKNNTEENNIEER